MAELDRRLIGQRLGVGLGFDMNHMLTGRLSFDFWGLLQELQDQVNYLSVVSINSPEHLDLLLKNAPKHLPTLHHLSGVAPAYPKPLKEEWVEWLEHVNQQINSCWMMEDIGYWSLRDWALPYFLAPVLDEDSLLNTVENIGDLHARMSRPFLAEVPSCNFQFGPMHLYDFINRLSEETGCGILFDCGHHLAYNLLHDRHHLEDITRIDADRIVEIHVSGGRVNEEYGWRYMDTHMGPILPEVLEILDHIVPRAPRLRAITLEFSAKSTAEEIKENLRAVREIAKKHQFEGEQMYETPKR